MKKILLLTILFLIIIMSCNNKKYEKESFFEHFQLKNIFTIEQTAEDYISNETVYYLDDDTLITYYQKDKMQIRIMDHGSDKEDRLSLKPFFKEYDVDFFGDYYYVNHDTIFVLMAYPDQSGKRLGYGIFHFNAEGKLQNHWDINKIMQMENPWFNVNSSYRHSIKGMEYQNEKLYCTTDINKKPFKEFNANNIPVVFVLNVKNDSGRFVYGKPEIYGEGNFYGNHVDRQTIALSNDSTFVLSFPLAHDLFLFNNQGKLLKKAKCKSRFIDELKHFPKGEKYTKRQLLDAQECFPYYYTLLYDDDNQLFYRIVFHEQSILNEAGMKNDSYDRSISIMVIDKSLNVLGEYYIPPHHLVPYPPKANNFDGLHLELQGGGSKGIFRAKYTYSNKIP